MILEIPKDVVFWDETTGDKLCFTCAVRRVMTTDTQVTLIGDNHNRLCSCCFKTIRDTVKED